MTKTETRRMVMAAAAACEAKKAERISILKLDPADSGFTDYFLICSGANQRQNQTIATAIEETLKRSFGASVHSVEGYRQAEWILLDYVDFVIHIFSNEKRDFYDIERLRKTATRLNLDELKASLTKRVAAVRRKRAPQKPILEEKAVKKTAATKPRTKKSSPKTTARKTGKASPRRADASGVSSKKKTPSIKTSAGKRKTVSPRKSTTSPVATA